MLHEQGPAAVPLAGVRGGAAGAQHVACDPRRAVLHAAALVQRQDRHSHFLHHGRQLPALGSPPPPHHYPFFTRWFRTLTKITVAARSFRVGGLILDPNPSQYLDLRSRRCIRRRKHPLYLMTMGSSRFTFSTNSEGCSHVCNLTMPLKAFTYLIQWNLRQKN